ncbi:TlpA disulfide reductase family protein [Gynurincola endophyticus]|uniref:TlpA disulfide reductase family protein n=1 Tax=Gynurincola endophyticus TaxID=2479004 RepID=UPI001315727C|nr:TlpA disulfide reductase family protein [Gynurincola endophyticus]
MKIRNIILSAVSMFYLLSCSESSPSTFVLSGHIKEQDTGWVSLTYALLNETEQQIEDSVRLTNGKFVFEGELPQPTVAFLRGAVVDRSDGDPNWMAIFIEPGKMNIELQKNHFEKGKVSGSQSYDQLLLYQDIVTKIPRDEDFINNLQKFRYSFLKENPGSYTAMYFFIWGVQQYSIDSLLALDSLITPAIRNSFYGKKIKQEVADRPVREYNKSINRPAYVFEGEELNGGKLSLNDYKGNYLLVDFWGSWCVPCRQETPHIKALFKKYQGKGFSILGIAADEETPDLWRKAVIDDGTDTWKHILSSDTLRQSFAVEGYPLKLLIDPAGIIVGRYFGTDETPKLDAKLVEIYGF